MRFFEGCRMQLYFRGGKLTLEKKTERKIWTWNLDITLEPVEVLSCDEVIQSSYQSIAVPENYMEEIILSHEIKTQAVEIFGLEKSADPLLWIPNADLTDLTMTRDGELIELHLKMELKCTPLVHNFVRDYCFTLVWARFSEAQPGLPLGKTVSNHLKYLEEGNESNES